MSKGPIFNQVNLVVSDMDAAIAFYRLLGVDLPRMNVKHERLLLGINASQSSLREPGRIKPEITASRDRPIHTGDALDGRRSPSRLRGIGTCSHVSCSLPVRSAAIRHGPRARRSTPRGRCESRQ